MLHATPMELAAPDRELLSQFVRLARSSRRIRIDVPSLRFDDALARRIEAHVGHQPGVRRVGASVRSGRVVIEYEEGSRTLDELAALAGARAGAAPVRRSRARRAAVAFGAAGAERGAEAAHAQDVAVLVALLGTSVHDGLSVEEAVRRLERHGANVVEETRTRSNHEILVAQVANLPTVLLLGSAVLALVLGDVVEAGAIALVVGLNAAIGYRVERKNEELLESWRRLEAGEARVIRGGRMQSVPSSDLVPGDLLVVRAGEVTPADARVVDAHRLACDEAALTGESEPQKKWSEPVGVATPLAERSCMLHAGTTVATGRGRAVIVGTGAATEMARVRALLDEARAPAAPLTQRMEALVKKVTWLGVGASVLAGIASLLHRRPPAQTLRNTVALGVAAIPEGLPVTATAALVRSMGRMRRAGMVVRRVASAETLGGVTVVCADKTGTLTRNQMRLELIEVSGRRLDAAELRADAADPLADPVSALLTAALLNSAVELHRNGSVVEVAGSSTECALVDAAHAAGLDGQTLKKRFPRRTLHERSDGVHYVVSSHDAPGGGGVAFVKGAPEQVAALCDRDGTGPLDDAGRAGIVTRNRELADEGLRVLAVAWQPLGADVVEPSAHGWIFLGLAGLRDPLREHARDAVHTAARAGIRTIIITGDQHATAVAIARQVGLAGEAVDGAELAAALRAGGPAAYERLGRIDVVSRATPADKLAIVQALRARGEIVAMCGDGINDAPALKAADVGIAVGVRSSDMARQTADVVLENEDLRSILAAVGEGRIVQDNLRRAARFLIATNLSEVALVLGGAVFGRDPLSSMQLLWINLLTDTLPALALALEEGDPDVLDRKPAPPGRPMLDAREWRALLRDGLLLGGLGGAAFASGGSTAAFSTLTSSQFGYAVVCRAPGSRRHDRFATLVGGSILLQLGALTLAPLRGLLRMPAPGPLAFLGFAAGLVLPAAVATRGGPQIIVKGGAA